MIRENQNVIRFLLRMIHNRVSNKANGQLVLSTHDTSILDLKILRRNQIWFVKEETGDMSVSPSMRGRGV